MTHTFDTNARKELKQQQKLFNPLEWNGKKPNEMFVKKVDASFCRPYIAEYHYSHIMPDNAFNCFAGFYGDKIAGVIVYGNGANNNTFSALIPDIEVKNCRELMRLWSADGMPKNTESKLIAESLKMLPKEIFLVVSFADPSHNHLGIIYQATNFLYCGMSNPSKMLKDKKGKIFHVRSIGTYKRRHPELRDLTNKEVMEKYGWEYVESAGKHRYVILRGEKWIKNLMYEKIKDRILEYPKALNNSIVPPSNSPSASSLHSENIISVKEENQK